VDFVYDPAQLQPLLTNGIILGRDDSVSWFLNLNPGEARALTFSMKVPSTVVPGTKIAGLARVLGVGGYPTAMLSLPVMGKMPQTGADDAFLAAQEDTSRNLSPVSSGGFWSLLGL
jgi:hypothetical protein